MEKAFQRIIDAESYIDNGNDPLASIQDWLQVVKSVAGEMKEIYQQKKINQAQLHDKK